MNIKNCMNSAMSARQVKRHLDVSLKFKLEKKNWGSKEHNLAHRLGHLKREDME